jgi:putative FmdB family regulatory protein
MPIYEFECAACGERFEEIMAPEDEAAPACPACGKGPSRKLLSAGNVRPQGIPKGSGGFEPPACNPGPGGCGGCGTG